MTIPRSHDSGAKSGAVFQLSQPWQPETSAGFQQTEVRLAWRPDALLVEAFLHDADVRTSADAHNQQLWTLGDVFEVFAQVEGREDYIEMHVAPNNMRMHLKLPRVGWRPTPDAEPLTFEELLVEPVGFTSEAGPVKGGWQVSMAIPAAAFGLDGFSGGDRLRISFCRYDYNGDNPPVLSTTAAHCRVAFHQPEDWTKITLGNA